jgi:hypothetical protein
MLKFLNTYLRIIQENSLNKINGLEDLKKVKYLFEIKELNIPLDKILIAGSATLSLYGIRENKDLDLSISKSLFQIHEKDKRFKHGVADSGSKILSYKHIDVHNNNWPFKESVEEELKNCLVVNEYHFYSLYRLLEWKEIVNRPKDQEDIKLINEFLRKNKMEKN